MPTIYFIAEQVREKPKWSSEDVNTYEVRYHPPRGAIHGTGGADFSNILLEAVCGLPKHNSRREPVRVTIQGDFPQKYLDELRTVFDFYARAKDVKVEYQTR